MGKERMNGNGGSSKWQYTWEAQTHLPILKLFLFNPTINPYTHCSNLNSQLILNKSLLLTTFLNPQSQLQSFLNVPIPSVLIDADTPLQYKAADDYIEIKLVLLLPIDHPISLNFHSNPNFSESNFDEITDLKCLSLDTEGVRFYCRNCSAQLTKPIKLFTEMPSTNWSEVADNWFGGCCCSFGGIGDKLVAKYANSYASAVGTCLLSTSFVVLSKDDLIQCRIPSGDGSQVEDFVSNLGNAKPLEDAMLNLEVKSESGECCDSLKDATICHNYSREAKVSATLECCREYPFKENLGENLLNMSTASELSNDGVSVPGCCGNGAHTLTRRTENGYLETLGTCLEDQPLIKTSELPEKQKSFLNGFLGDIFMAKSSNLSKDVHWVEFLCPQCSSFLGTYPADNDCTILDGGVRFFKCYISTSLPTGGSNELFRKYTLERMFTNQLAENAKTELSYRTVIRDLHTKSAMLQIVLLNPNSFLQGGYCSVTENKLEAVEMVDLSSAIKVLFADCGEYSISGKRMAEEWVTKNQADEVYMFAHQIKELIKILNSAKDMFPFSCTSLQGLSLSSLRR